MKSTIKWIKRYFSFLCQMFMHFSISRYIWKSKHSIYCCYAPVKPYQCPRHYHFSFQFSYNFFNIYLFFKYLYFLQPLSIPYYFISPLPSTLILLFIFLFSVLSYSHHFTINLPFFLPFFTYFSLTKKKKKKKGSLSLSQFFGGIFIFLSSLL